MGLIVGTILAGLGALVLGATAEVDTENAEIAVVGKENIIVGAEAVVGVSVKDKKKNKNYNGYIKKSDLDNLTTTTVDIPQNFAGLEAVMTPTRLEEQLFRIVDVHEDDDCVTITARHVWYDNIENYTLWKPDEKTKYTAAAIARNILSNAISTANMRVASDCTDEIIGKDLDFERKNLVECFLDPEKGLCKKFGLSLIRNNWDCYVLKEVGYNRGFVVEDKKNLLGVQRHEQLDGVKTRVCPFAKDEKGNIVWLNNNGVKWVDADNINDYPFPRIELYDTKLQYGKDNTTAANVQEKLLAAAQKRFTEDHINYPPVEMTVEFLSLGDTEEYVQYRGLDKVYLYDIISIKDAERGYQYTAQVVAVEHDILTGMLNSVTIGKLDNWDGTRKIAVWQVPEISGENIRLKSIMAGAFSPGAILGDDIANGGVRWIHIDAASIDQLTTEQLDALNANIKTLIAGKITADDITAGSITADRIDAEDLAAAFANINVLNAAIADIAEAEIGSANIGFAQIKALTTESLIARDAVTDRYYIDKLAVRSAQMVQATVGELIVKATNDHYYRLDINAQGELSPTDVTSTLTNAEKTAGVTSDGHSAIIETDLTVADLSASNMKAINALIDKLTASRIDVDELFARQATITALNTVDIRGNTYLQMMVEGYGTTYTQWTDPASQTGNIVKDGDVWYKGQPMTHAQMASYTHAQLAAYTHKGLEGYQTFLRKSGAWVLTNDPVEVNHTVAMIGMETDRIAIRVEDAWTGITQLNVRSGLIEARVATNEGDIAALELQANQFALGLSNAQGDIVTISGNLNSLSGDVTDLSGDVDTLSGNVSSLTIAVGNKYTVVSDINITQYGVAVSGSKYIKLDVNSGNYVHIDQNGIEVMGNRIKVNGEDIFARDDLIIMNPNATASWRRTVSGIENHQSGHHDWVMIRPFYDASITYAGVTGQAQQQTPINNKYTESGSSGKAFGGAADWYNYAITLTLGNTASVMRQLTVQLFLANKPFSFDNSSADRRAAAAAQANVICPEVTGTIGANNTLTLNIDSGHVGYNLCGENNSIYYYIYGLNYEGMNVNANSMTATTDTTNGRVPCTIYYYN